MVHLSKSEQKVYEHLKDFGHITSWEAIKEYGNTRLSATIFNLRKKGFEILTIDTVSKNRYGDKVRFAEYRLIS